MKQSESVKTLLETFTKVQAELQTLPKDKNGYGYKYTDLDTVISYIRPIFAQNKLGFMQTLTTLENGKSAITTRLFNAAGEWLEDTTPLPEVSMAKTNAAQNLGAAITYMKRYTLCAMLGISSDEDVDGNVTTAVKTEPAGQSNNSNKWAKEPAANKETPALAGGPDTPEQKKRINEILATKKPDGSKVFSAEDCAMVTKWRTERTAEEVIQNLKEMLKERTEAFEEDIPYEPTEEDKKNLNIIF